MRNDEWNPSRAGTRRGAGYDKAKQTQKIIAFPTAKRTCRSCQILFTPARPHFSLCVDCWRWHRVFLGTQAARSALREVAQ